MGKRRFTLITFIGKLSTRYEEMSKFNNTKSIFLVRDYGYWLNRICQIFVERVSRPWLSIDWIYKLTTLGRESEQCISVLHDFTNKVESFFYLRTCALLIYWPD